MMMAVYYFHNLNDMYLKSKTHDIISEQQLLDVPNVAEQLFKLMYKLNGVGLAANQVGINVSMFVMDTTSITSDGVKLIVINPLIHNRSHEQVYGTESCLSIPNKSVKIGRSKIIHVQYQESPSCIVASSFLSGINAVVFQHEFDHLQGKLITDYENK